MSGYAAPSSEGVAMSRPKFIGPRPPCSVDGCYKESKTRGWCVNHFALWRRHGNPEGASRPRYAVCVVDGCSTAPRSGYAEYCEMHYGRLRRHGTLDEPIQISGTCLAEGCDAPAKYSGEGARRSSAGYCRLHYLRLRRRGDVHFQYQRENTVHWTGDAATAMAVHQRLKVERGKASSWSCVDCAVPAAHWSYDHADPNEAVEEGYGPYSIDLNHYFPRCVKCHKRFDLDHLMEAA